MDLRKAKRCRTFLPSRDVKRQSFLVLHVRRESLMTTPLPTRVDGMEPLEPVPFIDLVAQYQTIADEVTFAVNKVFSEQRFILGDEVLSLESETASYCDSREAIGCASG